MSPVTFVVATGGIAVTEKLSAETAVSPFAVTVTLPEVFVWAVVETVAVIEVAVASVTVACTPAITTRFSVGSASKLVPVIVTVVPGNPLVGSNPVMVGIAMFSVFVHACKRNRVATIGMAKSKSFFLIKGDL